MTTMFWIWMAAAVIFLILELLTPGLIFASFAVAAAVSGVYAQFNPLEYYWQMGIFVAVSLVLLPSMRPFARRITKPSPVKSNVDRLVGRVGLVTRDIDPDTGGQVNLDGETWRAMADRPFAAKERVRVVAVNGNRLKVEAAD